MTKLNPFLQATARSPFLWGVLGAIGFYAVLDAVPPETIGMSLVLRYFTHHPVEYMETVLFAVGLAALIAKLFDVAAQRAGLRQPLLGDSATDPLAIEECGALLERLDRLPQRRQGEHYVARVRAALEHVARRGTADTLDDELKYLADCDAGRLQTSYGLFRVIVWAIPILGFLGTVIGITMALNGVDMNAPEQSMHEVLGGLGVKFDTTALALTLAMALMFVHYFVERAESRLLDDVDRRVWSELSGRFAAAPAGAPDGNVAAVRRVAEAMLAATESLAERQTRLWQAAVESAAREWTRMSESAAHQVQAALAAAAGDLARQADVLRRAVEAAGDVVRLEDALNRNLAALAGEKHFEQTVLSLAAAVNMLGARLADAPAPGAAVRLEPARRAAHAA